MQLIFLGDLVYNSSYNVNRFYADQHVQQCLFVSILLLLSLLLGLGTFVFVRMIHTNFCADAHFRELVSKVQLPLYGSTIDKNYIQQHP